MKRFNLYLILSLAAMLFAGCAKEVPATTGQDSVIFDARIAGSTRTPSELPINLYALKGQSTTWSNLVVSGAPATFDGSAVMTTANTFFWPQDGSTLHFVALANAGDVSTPSVTTNDGNIALAAAEGAAGDYLLSNNLVTGKNSTDRTMEFRHLMCQLKVKVNVKSTFPGDHDVTIGLKAGKTTGVFNALAAPTVKTVSSASATAYTASYSVTTANGGADDTEKIFYLIPDGTTLTSIASVTVDTYLIGEDMPIAPPAGGSDITLEAGESYTVTVNIDQPTVASVTMTPGEWTESDLGDIMADENGGVEKITIPITSDYFTGITQIEFEDAEAAKFTAPVSEGNITLSRLPAGELTKVKVTVGANIYKLPDYGYLTITETAAELNKGDGTAAKPKFVANRTELEAVGTGLALHYGQICDISLSGSNWTPLGALTGSYDGGGNSLSNLTISLNVTPTSNAGLFATVSATGKVKNVVIASGNISSNAGNGCGSIAAVNNGVIENCVNNASINGNANIGGIAGSSQSAAATPPYAKIVNCRNNGNITATANNVGGIVGTANQGVEVIGCLNTGNLSNPTSALTARDTGGIVGATNNGSTIKECFNTGNVSVGSYSLAWTGSSNGNSVGGIVGKNQNGTLILNCGNSGSIEGKNNIGGIAGSNTGSYSAAGATRNGYSSEIIGCANLGGSASGSAGIGGVMGVNQSFVISCYSKGGSVTGQGASAAQIGGVAGTNFTAYTTKAVYAVGTTVTSSTATTINGVIGNQAGTASGLFRASDMIADANATEFSGDASGWPVAASGNGWDTNWSSLGGWNFGGATTVYPTLGWEAALKTKWPDVVLFQSF